MGKPQTWRMDASTGATTSASLTSNQTYAAYTRGSSVYVASLDCFNEFGECNAVLLPYTFGSRPILALSPLRNNLLSVSTGSTTVIWDIETNAPYLKFQDSERSVTSSAWSNHDTDVLALGHIDGRISIWDLHSIARPRTVLFTGSTTCNALSWSKASPPILAACSGRILHIWNTDTPFDNAGRRHELDSTAHRLFWRSGSNHILLTATAKGVIEEWEADASASEHLEFDEDQDEGLFGDLEDLRPRKPALLRRNLLQHTVYLAPVGFDAILVLNRSCQSLQLYNDVRSVVDGDPMWTKELQDEFEDFNVFNNYDAIGVIATDSCGVGIHAVPPDILCQLPGIAFPKSCQESSTVTASQHAQQPDISVDRIQTSQSVAGTKAQNVSLSTPTQTKFPPTMRPNHITRPRPVLENSTKPSKPKYAGLRSSPYSRPATGISNQSATSTLPAASPREAMKSSLELPNIDDEAPSMPFLSPTIPSRKPSSSMIPTLSDDIILPPPEHESFGSLPSTAVNDSDSDDENFDGDALKGSGTLMMPGGANVPLPKSCGAFFAPNGQLITYFPPKPRMKSTEVDGLSSSQPEERSTKASRLFPVFGNLALEAHDYEDSDTESTDSQDNESINSSSENELFFPAQGLDSWPGKLAPMHTLANPALGQHTVTISVRNINNLISFRPELAYSYEVSCALEKAAADVSTRNADAARALGLEDSANIWCLLALLLRSNEEFETMSQLLYDIGDAGASKREGHPAKSKSKKADLSVDELGSSGTDIVAMARRASRSLRTSSGTSLGRSSTKANWPNGLRVIPAKLEASWVVSEIFAWTEQRADVQMLACLSAVLLSSAQNSTQPDQAQPPTPGTRSSLRSSDYFDGLHYSNHSLAQPAPVLNAQHSKVGSFMNHSPAKPPHSSHVSSRNPSQPTTPYIDSLSSTPPFPFPKLSRQGSRLSGSGSASPEHHRSSFGAAAKFYAQSITDKISSYGTSPPARRFGTSPNNELSTSLPGGSWSKSVSFASGVDHVDGRRSSTRLAPDDGYDSDRTIEDTSLPHTPKSYGGPVPITFKNVGAFVPSQSTQVRSRPHPLLSPELAAKGKIWIGHYAEQLRRYNMEIRAAELDNIAGFDVDRITRTKHDGVQPTAVTKAHPNCSICYCKIHGVQHVCPGCLHTTHIKCFTSLLETFGPEETECPTGCGCACADTTYEKTQWDPEEKPPSEATIKRKPSLTDPRIWRARVQGDSW